jgi:hypothetical protein
MKMLPGVLALAAHTAERLLRLAAALPVRSKAVCLLTAWIYAPALTAIERFLDARAEAFSERGWV